MRKGEYNFESALLNPPKPCIHNNKNKNNDQCIYDKLPLLRIHLSETRSKL